MRQWLMIELWGTYVRRHAAAVGILSGLGWLHSCCSLLLPLLVGEFVQMQYQQGGSKQWMWQWLGLQHAANIQQLLWLFAGVLLLRTISGFVSGWYKAMLSASFALGHKRALAKRMQEHTASWKPTLLQQDNTVLQQWMQKGILDVPLHVGYLVLLLLLLHGIHAVFFYITLLGLCLLIVIAVMLARAQQPAYKAQRTYKARYNKSLMAVASRQRNKPSARTHKKLLQASHAYFAWQALQKSFRQQALYLVLFVIIGCIVAMPALQQQAELFLVYWLVLLTAVTPVRGIMGLPVHWAKARAVAGRYRESNVQVVQPILPTVVTL